MKNLEDFDVVDVELERVFTYRKCEEFVISKYFGFACGAVSLVDSFNMTQGEYLLDCLYVSTYATNLGAIVGLIASSLGKKLVRR